MSRTLITDSNLRVTTSAPYADGAASDFTPSAGPENFPNVDDATADSDTTFNESATVAHRDLFRHAPADTQPATVYAAAHVAVHRKDDSGSKTDRTVCVSGASTRLGTTTSPTTTYANMRTVHDTDPATSAAWGHSALANAQFGYEVVA